MLGGAHIHMIMLLNFGPLSHTHNSFSPLPSPASVSSTASNGSGGGAFPQDPSPSGAVSVSKHLFNKAAEHLTIASYVNQSFETWKAADSMMEQCRGEERERERERMSK